MGSPNPIRTLESVGMQPNRDDVCAPGECEMVSIKMMSGDIKYVEQCRKCQHIDESSLQWWVDDAIKTSMSKRAQLISVAAESEPFQFAQMRGEALTLREVLYQSLGAASMCWVGGTGSLEFDSSRATAIGEALEREVNRALTMVQEPWAELAKEFYGLASNSAPRNAEDAEAWDAAFGRIQDRFAELLQRVVQNAAEQPQADTVR